MDYHRLDFLNNKIKQFCYNIPASLKSVNRLMVLTTLLCIAVSVSAKFPEKYRELDQLAYQSPEKALLQITQLKGTQTEQSSQLWLDVFKAKSLYHSNKFTESQSLLINIESTFDRSNDNNLQEMTLRLMGQNFYRMGGFDQAMTHALKAKLIAEAHNLFSEKAQLTNMIAAIHLRAGEYELALNHFQQALNHFEATQSKKDVAKLKNNMAALYIETNQYDSARGYLKDALDLAIELDRPTTIISALVNQIELEVKVKDFDQAKLVFETCLTHASDENLSSFEVWCLEAGAEMYQSHGQYNQAIDVAKQAYQMAGDQKLYQSQINLGKILVSLYAQTEQFELALDVASINLTQVEAIKDEVLKLKLDEVSALNDVERTRSQLKFEREQNKLYLKNQRLTWAGIIILIPTLLIALLLLKSKLRLVKALNAQQNETTDALAKMREAKELNEKLAKTDSLTGLLNRREMLNIIESQFTNDNFEESNFLLMIDADHFKKINDQFGHATGDKVLVNLALFISKLTPKNTPCSRWGGEEFLVLLQNTNASEALSLAQNMVTKIAEMKIDTQQLIAVTVSIGMSQAHKNQSINDWINHADEALYLSKKNGRNQVTFKSQQ